MTQNQGATVKDITRKCWRKGCQVRAEQTHMGIRLCLVHWLRVRVSYNLAKQDKRSA